MTVIVIVIKYVKTHFYQEIIELYLKTNKQMLKNGGKSNIFENFRFKKKTAYLC